MNTLIEANKPAGFYSEVLLEIYPCKHPFELKVLHGKRKGCTGAYYWRSGTIVLYDKDRILLFCIITAIHEYAHHIHYTEFARDEQGQKVHGPEFWQIFGQLMWRAKQLGYLTKDTITPILSF